eukprot:m.161673 g.161673  ORF g.161673 m.161673 type:complete len:96 (+) comp18052_c0_seq3:1065-1352(+)
MLSEPGLGRYMETLLPVEKADIFRYIIVYERGGIYADTDVTCKSPFSNWLNMFGFTEKPEDFDFIIGRGFARVVSWHRCPLVIMLNTCSGDWSVC